MAHQAQDWRPTGGRECQVHSCITTSTQFNASEQLVQTPIATRTMDFTNLSQEQILAFAEQCPEFKGALKTHKRHEFDWSHPTEALATVWHLVSLMDQADQLATNKGLDRPFVVLYFSGSMLLGSITSMAPLARLLAKTFDVAVTLPTYTL
ncbi:hypothetical protein AC579_7129 [Pseudocercospora musae]|uniref:Uncharacterized protein n=1 Tax=Pseudocercospora musae TaxID=113226 RepID=A0A139IMY5_9PEZI|nr:hypothetical protein AC579_7129 [Pseudocercospora musae]